MPSKFRSGFTLMETLLAVAVVAVLLTSFLAVFGPATSSIRRATSAQDADRLVSALEAELATLREDEITGVRLAAFDKAFDWISSSTSLSDAIILFNYRADMNNANDGELAAYTQVTGVPGRDFVVQSAVRKLNDGDEDLEELLTAVEGRVFVVRMRQLVPNGQGSIVPATDGSAIVSIDGTASNNSATFEDAVISVQADFFALPASSANYVRQTLPSLGNDFEAALGEPLFTRNLAVRR